MFVSAEYYTSITVKRNIFMWKNERINVNVTNTPEKRSVLLKVITHQLFPYVFGSEKLRFEIGLFYCRSNHALFSGKNNES